MVSRYPIGGFAFHRHQFHLLLRHLGIFSQKERNFLQVDDEGIRFFLYFDATCDVRHTSIFLYDLWGFS